MITWLAENSDDEHLKKVKQNAEQHALKMEVASRSVHDEKALFDEDDADDDEIVLGRADNSQDEKETSKQRLSSLAKIKPQFEGLRNTQSGHKIQDIRELMTVPVRASNKNILRITLTFCTFVLGDCHCGPDQESTCNQSVQRQSLRRAKEMSVQCP